MIVVNSIYRNKIRYQHQDLRDHSWKVNEKPEVYRIEKDDGSFYFRFVSESSQVLVSAIELARALFLNNFHLTRTAFRVNGLDAMANIEEYPDKSIIRFNRFSDYPLSNLSSTTALKHLVWLLMSDENRSSFNSIFEHLVNNEDNYCDFCFTPPDLTGWKFKAKGYFYNDIFYANEITEFRTSPIGHLPDIEIYHPNKKEPIVLDDGGNDTGQRKPHVKVSGKPDELDFKSGVNPKRRHSIYKSPELKQIFNMVNHIEVLPGEKDPRRKPMVEVDDDKPSEQSGINHKNGEGEAKEFDYQINTGTEDSEMEMQPDELTKVESTDRLKVIEHLINALSAEYSNLVVVSINTYRCPKPAKNISNYYYENTQEARVFLWAKLSIGPTSLHILEIDNAGHQKMKISTPIIEFKQSLEPVNGVVKIIQSCVDSGFKWNTETIKECAQTVRYVTHPAKKFETGDKAHIKRWMSYFITQLRKLGYI
ncbi:Tn7-like element transposition protein TnsE [Catenovulum sp. 2E275]|uniref:Tn7-like element transposition protein TnsE n=1 Tax=Catenovulum sp. 2E275 TaxID=2980497 RepID=UPI00292A54F7|nr:Tn7-like element transposition protein TnsE [Catenovulum sp. 2E275]